jgi:hypothetical protein
MWYIVPVVIVTKLLKRTKPNATPKDERTVHSFLRPRVPEFHISSRGL